jgi:hypothetical protein
MFKSATDELGEWADRCRRWARRAKSNEQRLILQSFERLFSHAEFEAEENFGCEPHSARSSKLAERSSGKSCRQREL